MLTLFFLTNLTVTAVMTGLIWTIQLVHYPFFHRLEKENFNKHMDEHRKKISFIVLPVMLIELATSVGLVLMESSFRGVFVIGLLMLIAIWLSTALLQVPSHSKLAFGYTKSEADKLVKYNWIRTILWTGRLILMLLILSQLSLFNL
jgi:hypothetical protein